MATHLFKLSNPHLLSAGEAAWLFKFLKDEAGIPWQPSHRGCWERAHLMCSLIHQAGARPFKHWAFSGAFLRAKQGEQVQERGLLPNVDGLPPLGWALHVAPLILVGRSSGNAELVFDPLVCRDHGPVEKAEWLRMLNDPTAKSGDSSARMFRPKSLNEREGHVDLFRFVDGQPVEDAEYDDTLARTIEGLRPS